MTPWQRSPAILLFPAVFVALVEKKVKLLISIMLVNLHPFFVSFFSKSKNMPECQRKLANRELSNLDRVTPGEWWEGNALSSQPFISLHRVLWATVHPLA